MTVLPNFILLSNSKQAFEKVEGQDGVYRKELIYQGHFVKKNGRGSVEFELDVTEPMIDHWVKTFDQMAENKIDVPLPVEHTTDPESNRGKVVKLARERNPEREEDSLYCYVKFATPEAERLAKTTQVSLFSPPDFVDGKGRKYMRPIKHVALTDYPLVPGLAPFERAVAASSNKSIALSHVLADAADDTEESSTMTIAELAEQMGVEYEEGADDATIGAAILEAWNAGEEEPIDDEEMLEDDELVDEEEEFSAGDEDDEEVLEDEEVPMSRGRRSKTPVSASLVSTVCRARKAELKALCRERRITPARRDALIAKYADEDRISLAMSNNGGEPADAYEDVVLALSQNAPQFRTGSRTLAQQGDDRESTPAIVRDADRRREAAGK